MPPELYRAARDSHLIGVSGYSREGLPVFAIGVGLSTFDKVSGDSIVADFGTEQLEFIALSQKIGDPKYQQKVENVIAEFEKILPADGLLPIYINPERGTTSYSTITFGAMGDSFYEYLLKIWIQRNRTTAVKHYRLLLH